MNLNRKEAAGESVASKAAMVTSGTVEDAKDAVDAKNRRRRSLIERLSTALAPFSTKRSGSPPGGVPTPAVLVAVGAALEAEEESRCPSIPLLARAGRVLAKIATPSELCTSDSDLRQLLVLIFDIFRYREILRQILKGISFFTDYPQFEIFESVVHLFVFSLYCRHFATTSLSEKSLKKRYFTGYEPLPTLDRLIMRLRIKLAAEFSRMRIRCQVLLLSDLLPPWLSEERIMQARKQPITCWFNFASDDEIEEVAHRLGLRRRRPAGYQLGLTDFSVDPLCPGCIQMHGCHRLELVSHKNFSKQLILQERSLCLGPASLAVVLSELSPLPGAVVVTHALASPQLEYLRYLMSSLATPPAWLHIFSCSKEFTFKNKHAPQVSLHQKSWREAVLNELALSSRTSFPQEDPPWVAVLAVPPSSCSACRDPVSLACTRDGDISLLETLATAGVTNDDEIAENQQLKIILEEQRETLRLAMMIPTVQAVLYSTHSNLSAENQDMVSRMLSEANQLAAVRRIEDLRRQQSGPALTEAEENKPRTVLECLEPQAPGEILSLDEVPSCDLFHTIPLSGKTSVEDDGCFLSLMIRKEIVRFDSQYMIKMAESRGLFGTGGSRGESRSAKRKRGKTAEAEKKNQNFQRRRNSRIDLSRINAPTLSSINRTHEPFECTRHQHHLEQSCCPPAPPLHGPMIRWWKTATAAITSNLRQQEQENLPPSKIILPRHRRPCCRGRRLFPIPRNSIYFPEISLRKSVEEFNVH